MKIYKCKASKSCKFRTGSRKKIRLHIRWIHGIKGGKGRDPLSKYYESEEVD